MLDVRISSYFNSASVFINFEEGLADWDPKSNSLRDP